MITEEILEQLFKEAVRLLETTCKFTYELPNNENSEAFRRHLQEIKRFLTVKESNTEMLNVSEEGWIPVTTENFNSLIQKDIDEGRIKEGESLLWVNDGTQPDFKKNKF